MQKFSVLLSKTAVKELNRLDNRAQERIRATLKELENEPFRPRSKVDVKKLHKMTEHQFYRLRVGNFRAIYVIEDRTVKATRIIPRGKGYEWLD